MIKKRILWPLAGLATCVGLIGFLAASQAAAPPSGIGLFQHHADVGTVLHPGSVKYRDGVYTISGSGDNMWFTTDDFQFVWKKMSGDLSLTSDISFVGTGGNPHRKAVLMIRQSLAADSVYADVARHGIGLTSLQFRTETGGTTYEIEANINAPRRLRIVKRGDYFYMYLGQGNNLRFIAGSPLIRLKSPFYVGLGVCSHDKDRVETAKFSHVELETASGMMPQHELLYSTLQTVDIGSGDRRQVYTTAGRIEAPNWTPDGKWLLFNSGGHIEKGSPQGGEPETVDTGFATRCNNDHGITRDGRTLAISDNSQGGHESIIYVLPLAGGTPRRVTELSPSYFHGWSPDGKTITFCGERNGKFDVYTIPAAGGKEVQLTRNEGHNDGPEYSPDGKYIYFNSDRSGLEQIWRMHPDGSDQEHVITDETNDWFPHISPDGKWMVFLSYAKDVTGHPPGKDVELRLMSMADKKIKTLATLVGGQGTINVDSWSPDSTHFAFVGYSTPSQ